MTSRLILSICLLGINAIPIFGVAFGNWTSATALALYWLENLVGSLLIAVRIRLHQHLTNKQGHFRVQFQSTTIRGKGTEYKAMPSTFTREFLMMSLIFTLAHGVLIAIMLAALRQPVDTQSLLIGAAGMAFFQVVGIGFDTTKLRQQPFAWVKRLSQQYMGRIVLIHLALIAGVGLAAFTNNANFFCPSPSSSFWPMC
ncbi:MAG: hypothetical protein HC853_07305 [Anaerolineae bacterium]|nr:hypothetical protein [Anaerolineae bacterium]